ncbi:MULTISPECIES: hypothetical protein [Saccharothrix]|uniref:hypothetical protein n=1 Tax=Saccharothrix TaxID=2071 RepID=UPI00093D1C9E|nr:hypothetical protein [Saccharothrix sp. CB00851]OKI34494.1 hypothetical protein A6A25_24775 [Saccharothrix sp. CB00851]
MATTLPVPIEFSLPDGWLSAPPDEVGAPQAAFVALHPGSSAGFTANITISGEVRADDVTLAQLAERAADRLRQDVGAVEVGRRNELESAYTQVLRLTAPVGGRPVELVQLQVFLAMADVRDERRRAVLEIVLSATTGQFEDLVGDFQAFLKTIRPDEGASR